MLMNLSIKTTCCSRPHFLSPLNGLYRQVSLYLQCHHIPREEGWRHGDAKWVRFEGRGTMGTMIVYLLLLVIYQTLWENWGLKTLMVRSGLTSFGTSIFSTLH